MKIGFKNNIQNIVASDTIEEIEGIVWKDAPEGFDSTKDYASLIDGQIVINNTPHIIVPNSVTAKQARLALLSKLPNLSTIDSIIEAMPEPSREIARISWEYETEVRRDSVLVVSIGHDLNLTDDEIDDLFILAATL